MSSPPELDLGLGLLDHQLLDSEGRRCGNVDDLELEGFRDGRPRVAAILVGPPVWRRRGWLGRLAALIAPGGPVRVPWEEVDKSMLPCTFGNGPRAPARPRRRPCSQVGRMDPGLLTRFTDFLGTQVVTESGQAPGRVHDLRAERTPRTLMVTGLMVGRNAASSSGSVSALRRRALESGPTTSFRGRQSSAPIADRSSYGTTWRGGNRLRAPPLYLTEAHIEKLLTPADALAAIEACFERQARGVIRNRPRARTRAGDGALAVMSAVDEELGFAGLKSYTALPAGTPFVVLLFDLARAELAAVIEADKMGSAAHGRRQRRRGQVPGEAVEARTLGIIGCGWQAESQVACIREALPGIEQVVAYCRTEKSLRAFCKEVFGAEAGESHQDAAEQDGSSP